MLKTFCKLQGFCKILGVYIVAYTEYIFNVNNWQRKNTSTQLHRPMYPHIQVG